MNKIDKLMNKLVSLFQKGELNSYQDVYDNLEHYTDILDIDLGRSQLKEITKRLCIKFDIYFEGIYSDNDDLTSQLTKEIKKYLKTGELKVFGSIDDIPRVSLDDARDIIDFDERAWRKYLDAFLEAGDETFGVSDEDVFYQIINHHDGFTEDDSEGYILFEEPVTLAEFNNGDYEISQEG